MGSSLWGRSFGQVFSVRLTVVTENRFSRGGRKSVDLERSSLEGEILYSGSFFERGSRKGFFRDFQGGRERGVLEVGELLVGRRLGPFR